MSILCTLRRFGLFGVGLAILAMPAKAAGQTFTKDVAPILQQHCQTCHRPDTFAPMSLLTYEDARPWARSIKQKVAAREMPPWYIDRHVGITKFKDDPSLSDGEIATIVAWVDQGAPAGNQADMPAARTFSDVDKWHIGDDRAMGGRGRAERQSRRHAGAETVRVRQSLAHGQAGSHRAAAERSGRSRAGCGQVVGHRRRHRSERGSVHSGHRDQTAQGFQIHSPRQHGNEARGRRRRRRR